MIVRESVARQPLAHALVEGTPTTRSRPAAFAAYRAESARFTADSVLFSSFVTVTPTLTVTRSRSAPMSIGSAAAERIFSATAIASST